MFATKGFFEYWDLMKRMLCTFRDLGSVVRKVYSDIHHLHCDLPVTGKTHFIVQHFRVEVTFYLLRVKYFWCHCFLPFGKSGG